MLNATAWRKDAADAESFFCSPWFEGITGHSGRPILTRLKNDCNFRNDIRRRLDEQDEKRGRKRKKEAPL